MTYQGFIQKSRSYDLAALSGVIDAALLTFLAYNPEQLGITLPVYFGIRLILTALQFYLRAKTTGPVGEK